MRLVCDAAERARWDRLMDERHYPGFRGVFGEGLPHVAMGPDDRWLALPKRCAGAFRSGARNAWTGWAPEQQFRRLPLVANNCRFLCWRRAGFRTWRRRRLHCRRGACQGPCRSGSEVWRCWRKLCHRTASPCSGAVQFA